MFDQPASDQQRGERASFLCWPVPCSVYDAEIGHNRSIEGNSYREGRRRTTPAVVPGNSDPADKLGFEPSTSLLPNDGLAQRIRGSARSFAQPRGPSDRSSRSPTSAHGSTTFREAAEVDRGGSFLLGWAGRSLARLAFCIDYRQTGHGHRMAPNGLPPLLDLEGSPWPTGEAEWIERDASTDP